MASRCSQAEPLPPAGSEKLPSLCFRARRIRRSRRGGPLRCPCWPGGRRGGRDSRSPCRFSARLPQASASPKSSCSNEMMTPGLRLPWATCRSRQSPGQMHGWPCPEAARVLLRARGLAPIYRGTDMGSDMTNAHSPKSRDSVDQDQFLTVLSREDALKRFEAALFPRPVASDQRRLSDALGCALAQDIVAPIDV